MTADETTPAPEDTAPRRKRTAEAVLGWCATGYHRTCPVRTPNLTCGCTKCGDEHGADYAPAPASSRFDAIYAKYRNK